MAQAKSGMGAAQQVSCIEDCHNCCCDCIVALGSVLDKVTADVQAVLNKCIASCRDCCNKCHSVASGLKATP